MRTNENEPVEYTIPQMAIAYVALMALALLTWGLSHVRLGMANDLLALAIAITKALLVVAIFMNLFRQRRLPKVFAAAGVCWLILMGSIVTDDFTRRWDDLPQSWVPAETRSSPVTPTPFQGFISPRH